MANWWGKQRPNVSPANGDKVKGNPLTPKKGKPKIVKPKPAKET